MYVYLLLLIFEFVLKLILGRSPLNVTSSISYKRASTTILRAHIFDLLLYYI